ncbi:hypothetical protein ABM698_000121 [Salmonella enterica subsp. enterica serovar Newport]|nr:hypothetical protein [Salmonella enterica subsp. enterica serovar Enteritidis]
MLIKELDDRINFIDKNDNFVGIEHAKQHHGLCAFDWWITDDEREIGTLKPRQDRFMLRDGSIVDVNELVFDTRSDIFQGKLVLKGVANKHPMMGEREELETKHYIVAVKVRDQYDIEHWLVMTNNHNGWYSLGWKSNLIPGEVDINDSNFYQEDCDGNTLGI